MRFSLLAFVLLVIFYSDGAKARCNPNTVLLGGKCLAFMTDIEENYLDARSHCQTLNGDLAIIDDCALMGEVAAYIEENLETGLTDRKNYWIGANDFISEGNWEWVDGSSVDMGAMYWARLNEAVLEPFPEVQVVGVRCLGLNRRNDYLFSGYEYYKPAAKLAPLCQRDTSYCVAPYQNVGGACLQAVSSLVLEFCYDGMDVCEASGGYLAIIDDCHMLGDVANYIKAQGNYSIDGYWIGAENYPQSEEWIWRDRTKVPMGVSFWGMTGLAELAPDDVDRTQNCAAMDSRSRYRFNDMDCQQRKGMVPLCEIPPL